MAENNLISVGAAATADLLSALSIPGGNTMQRLVDVHLEKRRAIAREALFEELRDGYHGFLDLRKDDLDPMIGMLMRFWRAAEEGLAKDNLRLLAQVIAGLKKYRSLEFDRFARWSSILESLSRDQILVMGAALLFDPADLKPPNGERRNFYMHFQPHMVARGFDAAELELNCATLARFGLFRAASAYGGMAYDITPWLRELGELANVTGVYKQHARGQGEKDARA